MVDDQTGVVGFPFSVTLPTATGGNLPVTYSVAIALDSFMGLSFNATSRVISGTPTNEFDHPIEFTATDRDGDEDTIHFQLTIEAM